MLTRPSSSIPSPPRSGVKRRDRRKRGHITPEGRERLRAAALAGRPWALSTGPRTDSGKKISSRNSLRRKCPSIRELQAELAGVLKLISQMAATRSSLL